MKFYKNNLLFCHNFSLLIFCGFILPLMDESEIISNILKIEKELSAREADPLKSYNADKVHLKQMAFHKCPKRNRWVFGGNRSGKTECGAVEAVYMARGIHPYRPNRKDVFGWVVSVTYEVQRDVAVLRRPRLHAARHPGVHLHALTRESDPQERSDKGSDREPAKTPPAT